MTIPLTVKGRGRLTARALPDAGGVTIRIDDAASPEFWCEIHLTAWDLTALAQAVEVAGLARDKGPTCVHVAGGMCPSCLADCEEDPIAWLEYGNHTEGLDRWRMLREEKAQMYRRQDEVEPEDAANDDDLPF